MSTRSWTAVATLLTFCPPGPVAARKVSLNASSGMSTSSGRIAPFAEIFGKRGRHIDRGLALSRDDEPRGVEQHRPARNAVDAVADDAATERLAGVRADLVGAPGRRLKLHQSGAVADGQPPPHRCRLETMRIV